MSNRYEIVGVSQIEKNKGKCGDYYAYKVFNDELVVMALSDGVGSRPCDWLASKTTCEKFLVKIEEKLSNGFDANCLLQVCSEVDKYVSNPPDDCKGMMSTLVAVIWNINNDFLHFINVGDSRIYKVSKDDEITQISKDDLKPVNIRDKQGNLILSGGFTVARTGLTNAFGLSNVKVSPLKCEFNGGDTIILASDGFYNCSPEFNHDILDIAHSFNLGKSVKRIIQKYMDFQDDDSTILILRNMNLNTELPENIMDVHYTAIKGKMAKFQIVGILCEKLKQSIVGKDTEAALTILKIMDEDEILPSREMLDGLIDLMKKENHLNGHIMSGIVNLIKKNMKRN